MIALAGRDVPRLRLGVGEPPPSLPAEDYVLQRFRRGELAEVEAMLERATQCVLDWLDHGSLEKLVAAANAGGESKDT